MLADYLTQAPRINNRVNQWIQGKIRNGEDQDTCKEAFNYFVDKLFQGENMLNAKRDTQKKYQVQVEFDTPELPEEHSEKSTLVVWVG